MTDINKPQDNLRANADAAIRKSADAMQQGVDFLLGEQVVNRHFYCITKPVK